MAEGWLVVCTELHGGMGPFGTEEEAREQCGEMNEETFERMNQAEEIAHQLGGQIVGAVGFCTYTVIPCEIPPNVIVPWGLT